MNEEKFNELSSKYNEIVKQAKSGNFNENYNNISDIKDLDNQTLINLVSIYREWAFECWKEIRYGK